VRELEEVPATPDDREEERVPPPPALRLRGVAEAEAEAEAEAVPPLALPLPPPPVALAKRARAAGLVSMEAMSPASGCSSRATSPSGRRRVAVEGEEEEGAVEAVEVEAEELP